jgi:hypothetical protein
VIVDLQDLSSLLTVVRRDFALVPGIPILMGPTFTSVPPNSPSVCLAESDMLLTTLRHISETAKLHSNRSDEVAGTLLLVLPIGVLTPQKKKTNEGHLPVFV